MPEHKKGQVWSKPKNKLMLQFESETSKNAIYNGKITGQFEYWLWQLEKMLQKQLDDHWKATEKERKKTHTGKLYEKAIEKSTKMEAKNIIEATKQAIRLLKGEIRSEQEYLSEGYILTKKVLGKDIAEKRKKQAIETIEKAKKAIQKREKYLKENTTQKRRIKEERSKSKTLKFKDFDEFFNWFKYGIGKDLKLAYGHDYRKNEEFKTEKQYIEIFKDYDYRKVKNKLHGILNLKFIKKDNNYRIYLIESQKKVIKRRTKEENYQIRLKIIKLLYLDIFADTEGLALYTKTDMKEAYRHAKWLENRGLIFGQASSGTGISTPRGTYRTKQILWEPKYTEERDDNWKEYVNDLKQAMKM